MGGTCTPLYRAAATAADQIAAVAYAISQHTYALISATDAGDCGEWNEMSETARNVYCLAAKAAIAAMPFSADLDLATVRQWLDQIATIDINDIVADGGVTAGMVVQQEARFMASKLTQIGGSR
jgi:tryptophanase